MWCACSACAVQVGNHSFGQLIDCMRPEKMDDQKINLSNFAELKAKMAERCGMHAQILRFSETVQQSRLLKIISDLMADDSIHGIVVELPLPQHLNEVAILQAIGPAKDVDGLSFSNMGRVLAAGGYKFGAEPEARPTVPMGVMELLLRSQAPRLGGGGGGGYGKRRFFWPGPCVCVCFFN